MSERKNRICPVENAGTLDSNIRKWLQNPRKIVGRYIEEGMTVLDVGCGPGFFSLEMALMVGKSGRVIASDVQEGMLQIVKNKIEGTELAKRITLHKCDENKIGVSVPVDFVLLFYMVHEVPNKKEFFREIGSILRPNGQVLIVEPPFHVSKSAFGKTVAIAEDVGFTSSKGPTVLLSKTILLKKSQP